MEDKNGRQKNCESAERKGVSGLVSEGGIVLLEPPILEANHEILTWGFVALIAIFLQPKFFVRFCYSEVKNTSPISLRRVKDPGTHHCTGSSIMVILVIQARDDEGRRGEDRRKDGEH